MTRARAIGAIAGAALVALVAVLVLSGGGNPYKLTMEMDNANGLAQGSAVNVGGVPVGSVSLSIDKHTNKIKVTLNIDGKYAPVGRDATVAIVAQNVLGQKQVEVSVGHPTDRAPSGFEISASRISVSSDLDQLLRVLDPSTRARLAVLVNEAGIAFTGREMDLRQILDAAPDAIPQGTRLLSQLDSSNRALSDLLARSSRYVAEATAQRAGLEHLVDRVGRTAETVATERVALRQGLRETPAFLAAARSLLADLRTTPPRLDGAARQLITTATPLTQTLRQIDPFRRYAAPALAEAIRVAPQLTRLADGATPVLQRAAGTLGQVDTFVSHTLPPITATVNGSIDNTIALLVNWSRAIQFQDKMSHIFRGEASFAPDELNSLLKRLTLLRGGSSAHSAALGQKTVRGLLGSLSPPAVSGLLRSSSAPSGPAPADSTKRLLQYLLAP